MLRVSEVLDDAESVKGRVGSPLRCLRFKINSPYPH